MPPLLCEQRSAEWFDVRAGKITASLAAACLGFDPHKGPLAAFNEITGKTKTGDNRHTAWGKEFEDTARDAYEVESGNLVTKTGFWIHPDYPWLGASPDGLVSADGLLEIKCPSEIPSEIKIQHAVQMKIQMAVTLRNWCDYFVWSQNGHFLERLHRDFFIETALVLALEEFYKAHILTGIAPPRKKTPPFEFGDAYEGLVNARTILSGWAGSRGLTRYLKEIDPWQI